jgi:lipoyl(octanoyl) transferase
VISRWLGLQPYEEVEKFQKDHVFQIKDSRKIFVLGMEFEPIVTLGIRARPEEDLLGKQLPVYVTDRGGQATLHSPGQLVIYPMICLKSYGIGVKAFVKILMDTTLSSLEKYRVKASYLPQEPGIYTPEGKIAFCGLKLDQSVVRHGISINISNDLNLFSVIRSCGHRQAHLDRVANYYPVETHDFFKLWVAEFEKHFPLSVPQSLDMTI